MLLAFDRMVEEFRGMEQKLLRAAQTLHLLLLDRQTIRDFYISLDILPTCIPLEDTDSALLFGSMPFSFTQRGRYARCVLKAYTQLQAVADEYLNGRYYDDPENPGRKRLTVHYLRLRALAEHVNALIKKSNEGLSTTAILRYVKGMDPLLAEREQIMGDVCLMEGCELDKEMCFTPLDFEKLDLPIVQNLPSPASVEKPLRVFCNHIMDTRKEDVAKALSSLRAYLAN